MLSKDGTYSLNWDKCIFTKTQILNSFIWWSKPLIHMYRNVKTIFWNQIVYIVGRKLFILVGDTIPLRGVAQGIKISVSLNESMNFNNLRLFSCYNSGFGLCVFEVLKLISQGTTNDISTFCLSMLFPSLLRDVFLFNFCLLSQWVDSSGQYWWQANLVVSDNILK